MRIGFVTALGDEARTLGLLDNGGDDAHAVAVAGIGHANAQRAAERLVEEGAGALVSWGTAGSLQATHRPGTVVIYDVAVNATGERFVSDENWVRAILGQLSSLDPICKPGLTAAAAVGSAREKSLLGARFECAAVDMESASIAACAQSAGLPFIAIRVIVDPVDFGIPRAALGSFGDDGQPSSIRVARQLLRRPQDLPGLLKLAHWYRLALARLRLTAEILRPNFGTDCNAKERRLRAYSK